MHPALRRNLCAKGAAPAASALLRLTVRPQQSVTPLLHVPDHQGQSICAHQQTHRIGPPMLNQSVRPAAAPYGNQLEARGRVDQTLHRQRQTATRGPGVREVGLHHTLAGAAAVHASAEMLKLVGMMAPSKWQPISVLRRATNCVVKRDISTIPLHSVHSPTKAQTTNTFRLPCPLQFVRPLLLFRDMQLALTNSPHPKMKEIFQARFSCPQ
jgi:hypothetical protein